MFASKVVPRLNLLRRASFVLQASGEISNGCVPPLLPAHRSSLNQKSRSHSTAADTRSLCQWLQVVPELDEVLVPRRMSVSPLESWLSLRHALPHPLEYVEPQVDIRPIEEEVLPPILSVPAMGDGDGSATPLRCKNVLEIRRRMMNRHKFRKLLKRTKFLRKKVLEGRRKKKQKRFEQDVERIRKRAGLRETPEGWNVPKIFIKQYGNKRD